MAGEAPAATSPVACNTSNNSTNSSSKESSPVQQPNQLLNSSVDSGIAVLEAETPTLRRRQRLRQCQQILQVLQRDQLTHQQLRDRLSKLANKKWKKEDTSDDHNCNVCCADLDLSSAKNYVSCCTCGKTVCRGLKCADWRPKDAKWECQLCQSSKESLAQTSSWVAEQMSFNQHKFVYPMRARSEVYIPIAGDGNDSSMQFESVSQIGQQTSPDERSKIREYVEEIVAEMLSSNLDHIKVGQLSKSENYLQLFDKYHAKLSNLLINVENGLCARALKGDLPAIVNSHNSNNNNNNNNNGDSELADISQTRLRSLIETIIAETLRSSSLNASGAVSEISLDTRSHVSELANGNGLKRRHRTEHYFEPKIYQDLLATAVLNKIADKEGNSGLITESTPDLSGRHIDENFNAEVLSTTSGSSIEPRSDCSLTDHEIGLDNGKSQSLQTDLERESVLSDYIAGHMVPLPDFSASVTESEDDIGSISSSMIGDGNWEDNWLFKKKRSSANPSSIGMLVPAPKDNVRAQIGDKTADEVSDLSEMGSDIEDSSLDLLHCNDLNDRLLSKHLIGGQNTKLVLDELVDRTSLTSHTVPEEHEPAFTETTNSLLVAGRPVPTTSPPPPPPMIFQDDSLSEGPAQAPITAQDETDELASLEGCIGFSTVEYIDEEQMHETIPSVIEILAAMALGPMLAIPASEQPGAMTPSEMHTLKELSDLALAEINARTMDIAHHSLDIIEEENSEPAEPVSEPQFCITESPEQDNDFTAAPMQGVEESQIVSLEPSANVEVVHESTSTTMETPAPVEAHPEEEEVIVEPPDPVEVVLEPEYVVLEPSVSDEPVQETDFVSMDSPVAGETVSQPDSVLVEPPALADAIPEPESVAVEIPATEEVLSEPESIAVEQTEVVKSSSEPESDVVEPPIPVNVAPEPVSVAEEPSGPVEADSEPESVIVEPSAEIVSNPESVAVEPPASFHITPDLESVSVEQAEQEIVAVENPESEPEFVAVEPAGAVENIPDQESVIVGPAAAMEITTQPEFVSVEQPAPVDINSEPLNDAVQNPESQTELTTMESAAPADAVLEPESIVVEPESIVVKPPAPVEVDPEAEVAALQSAIPVIEPESLVVVSAEPEEVVPEQESIPVEQVALEADPVVVEPPAPVQIVSDAESAVVEPTAPIEVVADLGIVTMEPPPQAEGESSAIVTPAPVEAHPEPESVTVEPPDPDEVMSEQESMLLEQPALMEVVRQADNIDVEPPEAVEAIPKPEIATVGNSAAVEVVSKTEYIAFEPEEAVQNIPEQELVIVEQSAPIEFTPEPESVLVEQPGTVDVKSEADVDVREKTESEPEFIAVEQESVVNAPAHVEVVPEAESADIESQRNVEAVPEPVSLIMEPIVSAEVLQEPESIEVEPDEAGIETIPETITPKPESVSVQQPVTEENIEPEPSAPVEAVPKPEFIAVDTESVVVNSSAPIVPEIKSAAVQPVPHIPPDPEPELVAVEPPALAEPDSIKVEPEETVDVVAEPDSIAIDLAAPSELLSEPVSDIVEPTDIEEVVADPESIVAEAVAPTAVVPRPEVVTVEAHVEESIAAVPPTPAEVVAESDSITVETPAPTQIVNKPEAGSNAVEFLAPVPQAESAAVEVVSVPESVTVKPSVVPEQGTAGVEPHAHITVIDEPESNKVGPLAPVEIVPENESVLLEPPAPEPESNAVEPAAPGEVVPEPAASVEISPKPEFVSAEPPAPVEIISEPNSVGVEPAESVQTVTDPQFVVGKPPDPVEVVPEIVAVEPESPVEAVSDQKSIIAKPPAPIENITDIKVEPEFLAEELPESVEVVAEPESIGLEPPGLVDVIYRPEIITVEPEAPVKEIEAVQATPVEVVAEPDSIMAETPAPIKVVNEPEETPEASEIISEAGSNPVELSAPVKIVCEADFATVEVFSAPESVAVELPAAVEVVKENESVILEPPAPEPESNAVEPPALVEVFSEPNSIEVKPAESVEIVPDPQFLVGKPPDPVEVLPEIVAVDPKEPMDGVEEIKFVIIDPPVPGPESNAVEPLGPEQVVSDPKCIGLQPADIVGVVPDPESSVEKSPDPVKVVSVPEIVALEPEAPAEVVAEPELTSIEAAAPVKIEAESLGVKIVSESDSVAVEPAAPVEVVLHPESNKAEPPAPLEVLTESNKVEPESLAVGLSEPVEVLPKSEIVSVEPEVAVEESISVVLATPAEVIVEPDPISAELQARMPVFTQPEEPAQASNVIPEPIYIAVEPSAPVTIIPETESATVEVVSVPESVAVKSQVFSEPENAVVEPPAHVEVINEPESIKVEVLEPPAPVEIVSEPESVAVEPLTPVEVVTAPDIVALELEVPVDVVAESESTALEPTAPVKIVPESVAVEPAEPEEVVPDPELVIAKTPAPIEVITDPESITVEPESNAVELTEPVDDLPEPESIGLEVVAEPESIAAEPAAAEISPEPESVQVESAPIVDVVPKTEIVVMEVPAPVNAVPHTDPVGEPEFEIVELVGEPDVTPQTPVFDPESAVLPLADSDAEPNLAGLEPPASSVIIRATESEGAEPESAIVRIDQGSDVIQLTDSAVEASVCTPVEIGPDSPPETLKLLSTNDPSSFSIDTDVPEKSAIESDISILQSTAKSIQENTSLESAKIDCNALGKASQKCLRRQPNIPDTTPSDKDSPLRSNPVNLLGTICKFYIKDKRLLATIERRRRRSLIMHKYLSSFDSMDDSLDENIFDPSLVEELQEDSLAPPAEMIPPIGRAKTPPSEDNPIDFIEDILALGSVRSESTEQLHSPLRRTETIILDGHPNRFVEDRFALQTTTTEDFKDNASIGIDTFQYIAITENSPESHIDLDFDNSVPEDNRLVTIQKSDSASQTSSEGPDEDDVEAESFIVVSLSEITYNFINEILFSDQLSLESNHSDESEPSTACETFNEDADSDQEVVSERVLVLDEHLTQNTNSNSNRTSHANLHLTLTKTNTPNSGSRRTNGKLTNGSLRWSNKQSSVVEVANGGPASAQQDDVADDDVVLLRRFVPGSIAEREVKKWYNAVEMPNNPYAPEALKQRISGTQERYMDVPNISPSAEQKALASALTENPEPPSPQTDYKRYSRDYYINNAPIGTAGSEKASASLSSADPQHIRSAEDIVEDIVINEAQKASKAATLQEQLQESVYKALPVQVVDESLDTQSNPSLHSMQTNTTTSDESDTVRIYDFNKQETTVIRTAPVETQPSTSTTSSMESAQNAPPSVSSLDSSVSKKRERPVVLQFGPGDSAPTIGSPASTPTRGSTPPAFRFLQPKRRLIDPSQVLSVDEDDVSEVNTPSTDKPVIEDEVVHAMPSVKALAQAFLITSKATQVERRWRAKTKARIAAPPDTPDKPGSSLARRHKLEHGVSMAEVADESTISSDLSSLETDPSIHSESQPPIASPASPVPVRHGFLRSNIAFFENLKFK